MLAVVADRHDVLLDSCQDQCVCVCVCAYVPTVHILPWWQSIADKILNPSTWVSWSVRKQASKLSFLSCKLEAWSLCGTVASSHNKLSRCSLESIMQAWHVLLALNQMCWVLNDAVGVKSLRNELRSCTYRYSLAAVDVYSYRQARGPFTLCILACQVKKSCWHCSGLRVSCHHLCDIQHA